MQSKQHECNMINLHHTNVDATSFPNKAGRFFQCLIYLFEKHQILK
jgi:hypothetical protein